MNPGSCADKVPLLNQKARKLTFEVYLNLLSVQDLRRFKLGAVAEWSKAEIRLAGSLGNLGIV